MNNAINLIGRLLLAALFLPAGLAKLSGFEGTVIHIANNQAESEVDACSGATLTIGAGENWDEFVRTTISRGFAGLETLSGIPGTVAGAVGPVRPGVGLPGCHRMAAGTAHADDAATAAAHDVTVGQQRTREKKAAEKMPMMIARFA